MDRSKIESDRECQEYHQPLPSLIKDRARVIAVQNGMATLRIPVYSACAGCHSKCILSGEMRERTVRVPIPRDLSCQPGDEVDLHINPRFVAKASFLIYLVPAVILLVFAFLGRICFSYIGLHDPDLGSLLAIFISIPLIFFSITCTRKKMGGVENIHILTRSRKE